MFNPQLFLIAYGRVYANKDAMTPGVAGETEDGMSLARFGSIMTRCVMNGTGVAASETDLHPQEQWADSWAELAVPTVSVPAGVAIPCYARWWTSGKAPTASWRVTSPTAFEA